MPLSRFNNWLAVKITNGIGTMWCAYVFTALSLVSLPAALAAHSSIVLVSWIAQTFLQLVLLPVIMVGQNLQAQRHDELTATLSAVHDTVKGDPS